MANVVGTHVIVVDTAAAAAIISHRVNVIGLFWYGPAAVGDAVVMTDANGNTFWQDIVADIGTAANALIQGREQIHFTEAVPCQGIKVPTLTAGTKLFIYLSE